MLVVDASAVTELLLARPAGVHVAEQFREHEFDLHAPQLLDVEVLSALRRLVATGNSSVMRADQAVEDLRDLAIERYPHEVLVPRIWELRDNFSAYDAAYVALAEGLNDDATHLLTADGRLARAVAAHAAVPVVLTDAAADR
jgi:predicted nucleic acid-binding protein